MLGLKISLVNPLSDMNLIFLQIMLCEPNQQFNPPVKILVPANVRVEILEDFD